MATKWPLETFNSHNFLSISPLKNTIVCGVTMKMSKTCSLFSKNFWSCKKDKVENLDINQAIHQISDREEWQTSAKRHSSGKIDRLFNFSPSGVRWSLIMNKLFFFLFSLSQCFLCKCSSNTITTHWYTIYLVERGFTCWFSLLRADVTYT